MILLPVTLPICKRFQLSRPDDQAEKGQLMGLGRTNAIWAKWCSLQDQTPLSQSTARHLVSQAPAAWIFAQRCPCTSHAIAQDCLHAGRLWYLQLFASRQTFLVYVY